MDEEIENVINFWMKDTPVSKKYVRDSSFDEEIRYRFGELQSKASKGELEEWRTTASGSLALIILLDQFSRNLFRESPKAFEKDSYALEIAKESIEKGFDLEVELGRDLFYMPIMHSENLEDQKKCLLLFEKYSKDIEDDRTKFALGHKKIIEDFGRFPNRNKVLGRESTLEETEFLEKGGGY